ncbi:MAG: DUF4397 domain-containing protein, partial [Oscillospiraceae bacterium]
MMDDNFMQRPARRNTPAAPTPDQLPVAPLPPYVPDNGQVPEIPLPPIVGDPGQTPVIPLPPFVEDPGQIPVFPLPPIVGNPEVPPVVTYPPQLPAYPGNQPPAYPGPGVVIVPGVVHPNFCTVRFLNAVAGYDPFRVTVGNRTVSNSLPFGGMTSYGRVRDGFVTVTIQGAYSPRPIMYQQAVPFHAGELITLAIIRTNNGVDLMRISDIPCDNRPRNQACIRAINLSYRSPALDVLLNDGRLVFSDVNYKEVTNFRQAWPREYGFYIAQTPYTPAPYFYDIQTLEDVPVVAPNFFMPGFGTVMPQVSFYVDAKRGGIYS